MATPTAYQPTYDFTQWQVANPSAPLPGQRVDAELGNIASSVAQIITNLGLIQRNDGALANMSVGNDQLKTEVSLGINEVVDWTPLTVYSQRSYVAVVASSGNIYRCIVAHTSTVSFANDLAAGFWTIVVNFSTTVALAAASAASAAANSALASGFADASYASAIASQNSATAAASSAASIGAGGFINKFRNNTFKVWSRGTSGTNPASGVNYIPDGWQLQSIGATQAWQQILNLGVGAPRFAWRIFGNPGVTTCVVYRKAEALDAAVMTGKRVSHQINIQNLTGASITPTVTLYNANSVDDFSAITLLGSYATKAIANGAVGNICYNFDAGSLAYNGLMSVINFGNALNVSAANSIAILSDDFRILEGAALGQNNNPLPIEDIGAAAEVSRNARYLQAFTDGDFANGFYATSTTARLTVPFNETLRVPATGLTASGAAILNVNGSANSVSSAIVIGNTGRRSAQVEVTIPSAGIVVGQGCRALFNTTGSILFTGAEL